MAQQLVAALPLLMSAMVSGLQAVASGERNRLKNRQVRLASSAHIAVGSDMLAADIEGWPHTLAQAILQDT